MEATTPSPFTAHQTNRLAELDEMVERAFKILNGGRALGLDMLDLDVLGGFSMWDIPTNPGSSAMAYAHQDGSTPLRVSGSNGDFLSTGPVFTVIWRDEDHEPLERLLVAVGYDTEARRETINVLERTEAEVLSPADTALELTEEDVKPLEKAAQMYAPLQVPAEHARAEGGTLPLLEGILDERIAPYGHGVTRNRTLYVLGDECGNVKAIRPDGTILPVGHSMNEPNEELDGEREEIIRPRIEELRDQIETRREEALEEMTAKEREGFYMAENERGRRLDPEEWMDFMPDAEDLMGS